MANTCLNVASPPSTALKIPSRMPAKITETSGMATSWPMGVVYFAC